MERRTIIAVVVSFAVLYFWQQKMVTPVQSQRQPEKMNTSVEGSKLVKTELTLTQSRPELKTAMKKQVEANTLTVGQSRLVVDNSFALFSQWELMNYNRAQDEESVPVSADFVTLSKRGFEIAFDDPRFNYLKEVRGSLSETSDGKLVWHYSDQKVKLEKEYGFDPNENFVRLTLRGKFLDPGAKHLFLSLFVEPADEDRRHDHQVSYWSKGEVERIDLGDDVEQLFVSSPSDWIAAMDRYFILTAAAEGDFKPNVLMQPYGRGGVRLNFSYGLEGDQFEIPLKLYFGPKKLEALSGVTPTLDYAVDFGWFTVLAYPLLRIMKWFYSFFQNYGVAIILLTLGLKIITFPLTYKSMKSMKEMAKIQPEIQKIREKYKDNKEKLNQEMISLMRGRGYNPLAGCLPILIQMPVFFALYQVLYGAVELYQAPFALWIVDLSAKDPYYVTPVLMSITMFFQQKLTPTATADPMQQKMIQFMPLIFGVFMLTLPSGLTIYMLTNAVISILQQIVLNRKLDIGNVTPLAARA